MRNIMGSKPKYHNNRYSNGRYRKGKKPEYYSEMIARIDRNLKMQKLAVDIFYTGFVLVVCFGLLRGAGDFIASFNNVELARAVVTDNRPVSSSNIKLATIVANTPEPTAPTTPVPQVIKVVSDEDPRAMKLHNFLKLKGSPLADQSAYMLQLADEYDLPWTLMPSIAGKESSYGKNVKPGSYNPFGLGGAGSGYMYFKNWEEAILYEAKLLSNHYRYQMNKGIQKKYCPTIECDMDWAEHVTQFQQDILN